MSISFSRQFGWTLFLLTFASILFWLLANPNEREAARVHRNMMAMTTAAFQEAVIFAHMKYHTSTSGSGEYVDLFELNGAGIDFNRFGFPVGINQTSKSVILPITRQECRNLWDTLLAPMRPMLSPDQYASLTVSAINGKCVFTSMSFYEQSIEYNPETGRVSLNVVN